MSSAKKKILVFIDWFLPGYKAGGPVRSVANIVDHLRDVFDFFIITRNTDYLSSDPYEDVKANQWVEFKPGVSVFYLSAANQNIKFISKLVRSVDFDLGYVNGIYSFYFSILPVWLMRHLDKPVVVSSRGMLSSQAFSRKSFKKKLFLSVARAVKFFRNVCFHATLKQEMDEILRFFPLSRVFVIPNPVRRIDYLQYRSREKKPGKVRLVSIARISQEKNTLFALQVLSLIRTGQVEFDLYGTVYDTDYWQECQRVIDQMPGNVKVNFHGPVHTDKVIETFAAYHFSFMPSVGENFGHSIFESFAAGTPVIISSNTPWKNLSERGLGWDLDLKNKDEFVRVIEKCVAMGAEEYEMMSQNVYEFAQRYAREDRAVEMYKKMFEEC